MTGLIPGIVEGLLETVKKAAMKKKKVRSKSES